MIRATVNFDPKNGPVTIEVISGYATLGNFRLSYVEEGNYRFIEFGKEPKRIDDYIPDIFQIPVGLDELHKYTIVILGKYAPAPGKQQVAVKYQFIQNDQPLTINSTKKVEIKETTDGGFQRFTHYFEFEQALSSSPEAQPFKSRELTN